MGIEALKNDTLIIFISGLNLHKTPEVVQEAIASKEASGPTPIIAVFDASVEKRLGVIPYFDMKDVNGFTRIRKAISDHLGIPVEEPKNQFPLETWKDRRGRRLEATYVTSTDTIVTLRLANGKLSTMAISALGTESKKRIVELASQN
ncbi:MAG: hypothetical protein P1V20_30145 [Verrucomicrobiales bacterium]|nr:hypothetical protein [Verrucomicrobiales bacterium]